MKTSHSSCQQAITLLSELNPDVSVGKYDIRILPVDGDEFESEVVSSELDGLEEFECCSKEQYWIALESARDPRGHQFLDAIMQTVAMCDWDNCDIVMIRIDRSQDAGLLESIANYLARGIEVSR